MEDVVNTLRSTGGAVCLICQDMKAALKKLKWSGKGLGNIQGTKSVGRSCFMKAASRPIGEPSSFPSWPAFAPFHLITCQLLQKIKLLLVEGS